MAKGKSKKRRSAAQIAAQKKATRASKRARKAGKTHTKTPRKAARKAAARKAPRRYKRKARIIHSYKTRKGRRVKTHASHETPRRRKRRSSKRRKKNPIMETPRRRRKSRSSKRRKKNPRGKITGHHTSRRGRRLDFGYRRHDKARKHRRKNPLSGGKDFMAGVFGLVVGGLLTSGALRFAATHALTGSAGAYQDTPGAGQIYNAESPNAPIWSSWKCILAAGAGVVVPFGIASFVKKPGMKTFWQLAGFGALAVVGVKLATDGIAKLTGKTMWGERLFAPEIMAQRDLATGVTPPAMAAATLAGLPANQTKRIAGTAPTTETRPAMQATQPATTAPATQPAPAPVAKPAPAPAPTHETNHRDERPFNWATDGLGVNSNVDN